MESSRSGSLMLWNRGRSCTSQLMSSRCKKQLCTHDRAGSKALERHIANENILLLIETAEALGSLHQHENQLMLLQEQDAVRLEEVRLSQGA
ncbi:hypothetical protein GOODEAATRI_016234 [Goodea atripinnis]|uniref:Uncharacterized protein n=1 Tax=Goodea atripinnis TaxID=208336 RepID=A0ABV0MI95_9TELE